MKIRRWVAAVLAATILINPGAAAAQIQGPIYLVEEGDTLFQIALVFGTSVEELAAANGIEDAASIFPGQELVIPGLEGLSGRLRFDDIAYGETLHSLSLKYAAPSDQLARLNRIVHPDGLYAGQSFAYADGSASGMPLPRARRVLNLPGMSLLESAIALGVDPWTVRRLNRAVWAVPGAMLYAPDEAVPISALPQGIEGASIDPLPVVQGRTSAINLQVGTALGVSGQIGDRPLALVEPAPGTLVALQGIHALAEPGLLPLELRGSDGASFVQGIRVIAGNYGREALIVPEETLDPESTGPEDQLIAEVVSRLTEIRAWEGAFSFPTGYYEAFPSFFGTRRSYNGSAFVYYHTGLDLYGSSTTPVFAPAAGRVAFTDTLTVRGNVTYLDHGWGVYSGFLHQSEVLVQEGDLITRGQTIGYVGGTGRATGPHLHWEIWVGGVPVDPREWTERIFP